MCINIWIFCKAPEAITALLCIIQNWWFYFNGWFPLNPHSLACLCFVLRVGWNLFIAGLQRIRSSFLSLPRCVQLKSQPQRWRFDSWCAEGRRGTEAGGGQQLPSPCSLIFSVSSTAGSPAWPWGVGLTTLDGRRMSGWVGVWVYKAGLVFWQGHWTCLMAMFH